jgi:hypothetical protein
MRVLLALTGLLLTTSVTLAQKPNILYILADDLGKRKAWLNPAVCSQTENLCVSRELLTLFHPRE